MPRRSSREVIIGGEGQPTPATVLPLAELPENDPQRVKPPLCPRCGGRLSRLPGAAWLATCMRRGCPARMTVDAIWAPGRWYLSLPD